MSSKFSACAAALSVSALALSLATPSDAGGWTRDRGRAVGPVAAVAGAATWATGRTCGLFGMRSARRAPAPAVAGVATRRAVVAPAPVVAPMRRMRTSLFGWMDRRTTRPAVASTAVRRPVAAPRRPVVAAAVTTAPRPSDRGLFGWRMDRRR